MTKQIWLFLFILIWSTSGMMAQEEETEVRKVKIDQALSLEGRSSLGPDVKVLKGDVIFSHEGSKMYCDSAYFYSNTNSLEAFGRIHINRGDTVHLYGDHLNYFGNNKTAKVIGNVLLENDSLTLTTDELDYYMDQDLATYFTGGETINKEDTLRSIIGKYFARQNLFQFSQEVEVTSEKFVVNSDTLNHNTKTQTSYFFGPTEIVGDSNYIYCERGWYDHALDKGKLKQNTHYESKSYDLTSDSLYYDRKKAFGEAYHNIEMKDTAQRAIIWGDYARYEEATEFALVTKKAVFGQYDSKGDTLYMHADTLLSMKKIVNDTTEIQFVKAFHGVRTYRHDLQNLCDSLVYNFSDSTVELMGTPVIWAEGNQISAEYIKIFTEDSSPTRVEFKGKSFAVSPEDSSHYNQLKGKDMIAYFEDGKLHKVEVQSKGEVLYMVKDQQVITGINKAESEKIAFFIVEKQLDGVMFPTKTKGAIHPIDMVEDIEKKLPQFVWYEDERPKDKNDIFRKVLLGEKKKTDKEKDKEKKPTKE